MGYLGTLRTGAEENIWIWRGQSDKEEEENYVETIF